MTLATVDDLYELYGNDPVRTRHHVSHNPWKRGLWGKGMLSPRRNVILWATTDGECDDERFPYHSHVIRALDYRGCENDASFRIDPDGHISIYGNHSPEDTDRIYAHVSRCKGQR